MVPASCSGEVSAGSVVAGASSGSLNLASSASIAAMSAGDALPACAFISVTTKSDLILSQAMARHVSMSRADAAWRRLRLLRGRVLRLGHVDADADPLAGGAGQVDGRDAQLQRARRGGQLGGDRGAPRLVAHVDLAAPRAPPPQRGARRR